MLALLSSCGFVSCREGGITDPINNEPAHVVILSLRPVSSAPTSVTLEIELQNTGGPGAYYIEFRSGPECINVPGCPQVPSETVNSQTVNVLANYRETLRFTVQQTNQWLSFERARVFSAPPNSGAFVQTSCWGC